MRTSNLDETIDNTLTLCRDSRGALCVQVIDDGDLTLSDLDGDVYDPGEWEALGKPVKFNDEISREDAWAAIAEKAARPGVGALVEQVVALVGHDGTGDIRTIVDHALADGISDATEIAEIVRDARADAEAE